jgi:hypothetical protein
VLNAAAAAALQSLEAKTIYVQHQSMLIHTSVLIAAAAAAAAAAVVEP